MVVSLHSSLSDRMKPYLNKKVEKNVKKCKNKKISLFFQGIRKVRRIEQVEQVGELCLMNESVLQDSVRMVTLSI